MASLRKRYQESPERDAPPVSTPPSGQAAPPDDAKPVEQSAIETPSPAELAEQPTTEPAPVEQAAHNAIKQRLAEMQRASALSSAASQQQPQAAEPQQEQDPYAHLPERIQNWFRRDPSLATDQKRVALLESAHNVARHQTGEEFTDRHIDRMEELLGFKQQAQPNGKVESRPSAAPTSPRRQQYSGPPVSAPISREVPSLRTGKPSSYRAPLSAAEKEIARSTGISDAEYQAQKEKMQRLQAAGALQDGR
jgi:hypothetical protein